MRRQRAGGYRARVIAIAVTWLIVLFVVLALRPKAESEENLMNHVYLPVTADSRIPYPIVFVSRQIPPEGSVYWSEPNGMPGVGPYSRFQVASPGKLIVRETDGTLRTLINGANPTAASLNLIDVNAPDVSYDGQKIVFAGLPAGDYGPFQSGTLGAWRIYTINVDGTGLQQITFSDQNLDLSQFGDAGNLFRKYDDTDPVWLPDGRIVFASTRWPSFAQYSGVRTTNLHVVNADGSGLHRITSERNGAERPLVDPITGRIVYSRWWRNHRFAANSMETIPNPGGGYAQHLGLTTSPNHVGGTGNLNRNFWQLTSINPDGTDLRMWSGFVRHPDNTHAYGGAFGLDGTLVANYFPMANMTEAAGFGGLRRYERGPDLYQPLIGITSLTLDYVNPTNPTSYGIFVGDYAAEPDVFPDGRIVFSWAPDIYQDYGLYVADANGQGSTLLYDNPQTTELRARIIRPRPLPPIVPDTISQTAGLLPPPAQGPYDQDGTFEFRALNVYFNGPVDFPIVNAPPVGSAALIRFFIDHQRYSPGSFPFLDWPILLEEMLINPDGSVINLTAPANVPLFEQIRSADGTVPVTMGPQGNTGQNGMDVDGAAHVTGMNFAPPDSAARCVGCHTGHTMLEVPATDEAAKWTNLATGAQLFVSSANDPERIAGLTDRRVMNGRIQHYWTSAPGQTQGQWVKLVFPVPVAVRTVTLYNPRQGDAANSSIVVHGTTVRLYSDPAGTNLVASQSTGQLSVSGTSVSFNDVLAYVVLIQIDSVTGTFNNQYVASLAEVEVIGKALAP
jgi:hypothetical protein